MIGLCPLSRKIKSEMMILIIDNYCEGTCKDIRNGLFQWHWVVWMMVKSRSVDVRIGRCRKMVRARVRDMAKIRIRVRVRYRVRRWLN